MADYKNTEGYLRLKQELMAFENLTGLDNVYTEEIISKYKLYYSYPIYSNIDMPTGFIGKTLDSFICANESHRLIVDLIKQCPWKWYLLTGNPGIGKTHLGIGAMISAMGGNSKKGRYDTAEAIFLRIKAHNGCESEVVENLSGIDILIIDECEGEKITAFSDDSIKGVFQEIIMRRDINKKQTIIIGNKPEEVKKIIGNNGYSRFEGRGEVINLTSEAWKDYRPKIKKEANTADMPF